MGGQNGAGDAMSVVAQIHHALEVVYSSSSTNDARQEAQQTLEQIKAHDAAPKHGYDLASDRSQSPIVRHYALSLLEHAIKHRWAEYSEADAASLRDCALGLAQNIARDDPAYLRNKIALLWVEVAKRSWALDWMDMDDLLVRLWQVPESPVHKELVLTILEMLSDEIFNGDDTVVAVREGILSKASVEIFTPSTVLAEGFPNRQAGPDVRCGNEGWLQRITDLLNQCLAGDLGNEDVRSCALRSLAVMYSLMPWVIPNAVTATGCVQAMCDALRASHVSVQKASLEAMHSLYSRTSFVDQEFLDLVVPLYSPQYSELFRQLYQWSIVDPEDIDDDKYQFSKKLSELTSFLGNYMDRRFAVLPIDQERVDFQGFLQLLLSIAQSPSLVVSIPVLLTWTRLLNNRSLGPNIASLMTLIGPLLELCSSRLVRYEALPEDTQDPTFLFLLEDTDTVPERHAFLGNYRRYCSQVVESIVRLKITDAMQHILSQTEQVLQTLYENGPAFDMSNYSKSSPPVLRVDAQATVIEAALKGFGKWRARSEGNNHRHGEEAKELEESMETWCTRLLAMTFEDPLIKKRVLQLLVAFSTTALDKSPNFMLNVLEHILITWPSTQSDHRVYNEAIKELQSESLYELQRLAVKMPDHLLDVYDQIAAKVKEMLDSGTLDQKRSVSYQMFLFTIIHRSRRLDQQGKIEKLHEFITPVANQWQDEGLKQSLTSYSGFCELMALDKAQNYMARKRLHEIKDWGSVELDDEGKALQAEMEERQTLLPLRSTKSFLNCSLENVDKESSPYQVSCALWQDGLPIILPELLKFLSYAHNSHTIENWTGIPADMRSIVERVLTDRFWQAGISEGSKDEFYARVLDKKNTMEGLASTVRGSVRFVREACYAIIYCMMQMHDEFYGFNELPGPLAHALLADSFSLSPHQMINLLNLIRYLVYNCPVTLRDHFLPPLLATCCQQMDTKITAEWQRIDQQQSQAAGGDALTEEMKAESVLRQLTYTAVMMIADFLDPARLNRNYHASKTISSDKVDDYPSLRKFCLMDSSVVEPLLMFCTHVIRIRDTRCCGIMLRVFRSMVPEFAVRDTDSMGQADAGTKKEHRIPAATAQIIREYISTDVIKACITSIHEGYFVELQKDLATLIATIISYYSPLTTTPRDVLLSLPNMRADEVDKTVLFIVEQETSSRQQRAAVLDLLRDVKGVSVSEMGKLSKSVGLSSLKSSSSSKRPTRSKLAQQFMMAPPDGTNGSGGNEHENGILKAEENLEGVANLFET